MQLFKIFVKIIHDKCLVFFHDVHVYFGEFGFGSTTTPPIDIFLYSHHFSAWSYGEKFCASHP